MSSRNQLDLNGMLPLGEKRKLLNQFVNRVDQHEVDNILKEYDDQPSALFNLVKFMLADKFRRFDLMAELVFDGDAALLSGIVSKRWMYDESEKNSLIDSQYLLEQLFPNVSYICRQKVLHRIGRFVRNEVKVDQLWNAIEERYGFVEVFPLLQACSKNLISSVMSNRKVKLSGYQVVQLLQKYPDIGLQYFKDHSVRCSKINPHCSPLHYLYKYRFEDFMDLCINHSHKVRGFKIGRNRTTKMIRNCRAQLLEHPTTTSSLLKLERIQREFSADEFQLLFESTLPKDPPKVMELWKWVRTVPQYKQVKMIQEAYTNLYKINLDEHPKYMDTEYIFMLPEDRRLSIVEWKIENPEISRFSLSGGERYIWGFSYDVEKIKILFLTQKPISHSAPELKKLLRIEQDVKGRATLSKYLIQTCYLNGDLTELLNVLKLLSQRSRNDQPEVRDKIFRTLDGIKKMDFATEHWDIIHEMIQVSLVFKDDRSYTEKEALVRKYIAFRLESKMAIDDLVTMHIKFIICHPYRISFANAHVKDSADIRRLLESYVRELEKLERNEDLLGYNGKALDSTDLNEFVINLVELVQDFNANRKRADPIPLASHKWLITKFEGIAKAEEASLEKSCKEFVNVVPAKPRRSRFTKRIGHAFWGTSLKYIKIIKWLREEQNINVDAYHGSDYYFSKMWLYLPNHATILHYLRRNPSHLQENLSASLSKMLETKACVKAMRMLKHWKYSTLVDGSIKKCIEIMSGTPDDVTGDAVRIKRKCNAALVLSVLKEPSDYLALVAQFYPADIQVDVTTENSGEDYEVRKTIAQSLINISVPHLTFDALKKFCVGDYLKLTVNSLHSQLYRAPAIKSLEFLRDQLTNVPVSLQKHIIRLYCAISSVEDKRSALTSIQSSNVTIRYVVFLQTNKLFRSCPSQETWTMLKTFMDRTTADDEEILCFVHSSPELDTCPLQYISEYIEACFELLSKLEPSKIDNFIEFVQKIIEKVPGATLDKIVMRNSENADSFNSSFCNAYLHCTTTKSILAHRLSNIWCLMNNMIERGWDRKSKRNEYPARKLVYNFVHGLSSGIRWQHKSPRNKQICSSLLQNFKKLSTTKFFLEILCLELALLHVEVEKYDGIERLRQFGRRLAQFVDSMAKAYDGEIIFVAKDLMASFVKNFFSDEISKSSSVVVELVDEILKTSKTRQNQIISIKLLRNVNPKRNEVKLREMMEKITQIFNESNDLVVQSYSADLHN